MDITDKSLNELGLLSYDNGYYQINDSVTVDIEGNVRIDRDFVSIWIAKVYYIEELKTLIECINR